MHHGRQHGHCQDLFHLYHRAIFPRPAADPRCNVQTHRGSFGAFQEQRRSQSGSSSARQRRESQAKSGPQNRNRHRESEFFFAFKVCFCPRKECFPPHEYANYTELTTSAAAKKAQAANEL